MNNQIKNIIKVQIQDLTHNFIAQNTKTYNDYIEVCYNNITLSDIHLSNYSDELYTYRRYHKGYYVNETPCYKGYNQHGYYIEDSCDENYFISMTKDHYKLTYLSLNKLTPYE